ncbi:zinc metallopeptidase [Maribacter sp. PR1]|uniref:Neutral zinc metallopeptidase n=1 Tax=Maribacter cobaltidurans TaxID=1178778 RepID=A0ABU7IS99_9FLAO|nr:MULTISPECIES: neutral zinc metallopeptidase [Maribacter]MDC6388455.1 zinc metallopeptidase [Maribacter sp. PR1]MEE1975844.1 neutral zinc metallopeptidase [Maribacter cobaltidurans]
MKWKGRRQSSNVDDRRGRSSSGRGFGGFSPNLLGPIIKLLFSKVGLIIVGLFLLFSFITGNNPLTLISNLLSGGVSQTAPSGNYEGTAEENELADFSAVILGSTEDVWNNTLENYREPTLVLFSGYVSSACGSASSATGPFYCPGDEKLYLDLSFFEEMERQMNAPGDFAQAYVIAHEVGHHIQNLMGITDKIDRLRGQLSKTEFNKYSVRLELQADFLAGVWANRSKQMMESGDLQEALNAANAIGDDRLQKQSSGRVVPDSFTHGTSAQRMRWFKKGYETGDVSQGDTFSAESL